MLLWTTTLRFKVILLLLRKLKLEKGIVFASGWQRDSYRESKVSMSWRPLQSSFDGQRYARHSLTYLSIDKEMWHRYQEGSFLQHCLKRRHNHVPWNSRENDQRVRGYGLISNQSENIGFVVKEILSLDRWGLSYLRCPLSRRCGSPKKSTKSRAPK